MMLDFGLSETVLHIVRIIASVGGAVVGWFVCDPLTRLVYRLSFHGATPALLLLAGKLTGAATLSLLIYFFLPLGGGGGFGWGPGQGGGPGKGAGLGGDNVIISDPVSKNTKPPEKDSTPKTTLEPVEIEIIRRDQFNEGDGQNRFYLLKRTEPAVSLKSLEEYFKKEGAKIEVTPVETLASIGIGREDNPMNQLLRLTKRYNVKTLQTKGP